MWLIRWYQISLFWRWFIGFKIDSCLFEKNLVCGWLAHIWCMWVVRFVWNWGPHVVCQGFNQRPPFVIRNLATPLPLDNSELSNSPFCASTLSLDMCVRVYLFLFAAVCKPLIYLIMVFVFAVYGMVDPTCSAFCHCPLALPLLLLWPLVETMWLWEHLGTGKGILPLQRRIRHSGEYL